ncbi:MAG: flagellar motor protein MotA [Alphaproteobacteria bacterium]|nr:flagellar motor protein MotA [Alphaproteobacteria bacterium]
MARRRKTDVAAGTFHRTLTPPGLFLARMVIFLTLVGFIVAILHRPLLDAIGNNPALNGLIIAVLLFGIMYSFNQVMRLYPEIRWVNAFRIADPGLAISHQPKLLAPMATLLRDRTGAISLSTASMGSIMDSLASRLDESRDTGRYLVGLLVFLGLLGTFWGLLETIKAVGSVIGEIDTNASDTVQLFGDLKAGLSAPMKGMGTAFSSSLLGLAGSLILGFLELQASHAGNRFYNELEEWLSGITEISPNSDGSDAAVNRQLSATLYDMQRVLEELNVRLAENGSVDGSNGNSPNDPEPVKELARGVSQLINQMRNEQKIVREWVDEQSSQQSLVTDTLRELAQNIQRRGS